MIELLALICLNSPLFRGLNMAKSQDRKKEGKKKAQKTLKEKRAAKKDKKKK